MEPRFAVGVRRNGEAEPTVSVVGRSDCGSSKADPFSVIPARGQPREDFREPARPDRGDIFQEHEFRSKNANGVKDVEPDC